MNHKKRAIPLLWLALAILLGTYCSISVGFSWGQTSTDIVDLVSRAKSSADHRKIVAWYEQEETTARNQSALYRKLANTYPPHDPSMIYCEEISRYYDNIVEQYEKLAEEHRHAAARAK